MSISRKLAPAIFCLALMLSSAPRPASAEDYPSRRITFVVAAAAGGYADGVARIIAERLSERLKQNVVVENRGGAGGNIAAKFVAGSPADGYTVLVTTTQLAINETLYKHPGFAAGDLKPVSIPVSAPEVIVANPSSPAKNLAELIKSAKDTPLTFGSAGTGTGSYIEAEYLFKVLAKIQTIHVPFPGGAPAITALLGNHIHVLAVTVSPVIAAINRGDLRGLGIATASRMPFVSAVPTFGENGFPNFYASSWVGMFLPSGTPDAIAKQLNAATNDVLNDAEVKRKLQPFGVELINGPIDKTAAFFKSEVDRWGKMVRTLGLSVD
jgi:tripartite-type tricarboxylate transporter receptor subunit TctC